MNMEHPLQKTPIKIQYFTQTGSQSKSHSYDSQKELKKIEQKFSISSPHCHCPSGKEVFFMCTNPACHLPNGLLCRDTNCTHCLAAHSETCGALANFKFVVQTIQSRMQIQKDLIMKLYRQEEDMITKLRESRIIDVEKYRLSFLGENYSKIAHKLFVSRDRIEEKGQKLKPFYEKIEQLSAKMKNDKEMVRQKLNLIKNHDKNVNQTFIKLKMQRQNVIKEFACEKYDLDKKSYQKKVNQNYALKKKINSKMIDEKYDLEKKDDQKMVDQKSDCSLREQKKEGQDSGPRYPKRDRKKKHRGTSLQSSNINLSEKQIYFIKQSLNYPKKLSLIYRGSQNEFSAKQFHKQCDEICHTFVLVKNQYNKIMAGYTPLSWDNKSEKTGCFVGDQKGESFLLSLDLMSKLVLVKKEKAISRDPIDGPRFGQGYDLSICDKCDKNNKSYSRLAWSYNNKNYDYKQDDHELIKKFSGCEYSNTLHFYVEQYEVYRVQWDHK